jgi:hypothetical protein
VIADAHFRSGRARFWITFWSAFLVVGWSVVLAGVVRASWAGPLWIIGASAGELLFLTLLIRAFRLDFYLDASGMTVRNGWRTTRIDWHEVEAIGWHEDVLIGSQYAAFYCPAVAVLRRGHNWMVLADATMLLHKPERERVVEVLRLAAGANGFALHLAPSDIEWKWFGRPKPVNPELDPKKLRAGHTPA